MVDSGLRSLKSIRTQSRAQENKAEEMALEENLKRLRLPPKTRKASKLSSKTGEVKNSELTETHREREKALAKMAVSETDRMEQATGCLTVSMTETMIQTIRMEIKNFLTCLIHQIKQTVPWECKAEMALTAATHCMASTEQIKTEI